MNALWTWLKGKNWSTHAIAVTLGSVATFIVSDQQAQDFLVNIFKTHPAIATELITLAGIIVTYKRSSTAASTVAQSNAIQASDNPPTATQVKAAPPPAA